MFLHGGDFGIKDPQFGKDLGFYAFELPFYRLLLSYLFVAVFLAFVANLLATTSSVASGCPGAPAR